MTRLDTPLGDTEERLGQIIAFLPDPTMVVDRSGTIIAWNRAMEDLTGRSADEMVGQGDHAYALPFYGERRPVLVDVAMGAAPEAEQQYEALSRHGETVTAEVTLPGFRPGGAILWCKAAPLRDSQGRIVGAIESIRDVTEPRRARQRLQQSETEKRTILDAALEHVILQDRAMRIVWANTSAAESAGMSRDDLIGRHCYEIWGRRSDACPGCPVLPAIETDRPHECEQTTPDGRVWYLRGYPIKGPDGAVTGAVEMTREITGQKRREQALADSEARYRSLTDDVLDSSAVGIFILDAGFKVVWVNRSLERYFGLRREEIIGQDKRTLIRERIKHTFENPDRFADKVLATYDDNTYIENFLCHVLPSGDREDRWLEHWSQPIRSGLYAGGRIEHYTDVTDRVRAEENLKTFKDALENSTDAIGISTPQGVHYYQNETFTRMFGDIGNDPPSTIYVDHKVGREVFDAITSGQEWSGEVEMNGKDGNALSILLRAYPVKREGRTIAVVGVHTDITARKRAEAALAEKADELARSNADLQEFAYVASHDLQEPLRMVSSYVQLLEKRYADALDGEAREFIGYAAGGAKRMQTLINDLLQYSRVGTRGKPFAPTDCEALLEEVLSNLEVAITEAGARVTHDPLPRIMADEAQLARVFQNLVGNALKYCDGPPEIHVSAERRGGQWAFRVRDNGIGIDPDQRERIFVVFRRLHRQNEYSGTGVGLAISKRIVERHGGRIRVESEPGAGSTFIFTIPDRKDPSDGNEHDAEDEES